MVAGEEQMSIQEMEKFIIALNVKNFGLLFFCNIHVVYTIFLSKLVPVLA